jgi:hypothetical protein
MSHIRHGLSAIHTSFVTAALVLATVALTPCAAHAQTAPDRNPDVPEPLMFDLVRGLGAKGGELEVNALTVNDFRSGLDKFYWNPEIEWVARDGLAFELELAMDRSRVESTKLMTQITFGAPLPGRYIHGAQIIGERSGIDDGYDLSALYVGAHRFTERWSLSFLQGAKYGAGLEDRQREYWSWLGNATLFRESRRATLGLEVNVESPRSESPNVRVTPQIHLHRGRWALQGGAGVAVSEGTQQSFAALRLVRTLHAEPGT